MSKRRLPFTIPSLRLVELRTGQVSRDLAQHLREAIANGSLGPGERLPSTRALATSLGVARGTVVEVFAQLAAEGYLNSKVGAGTCVASTMSDRQFVLSPGAGVSLNDLEPRLPEAAARLTEVARNLVPQSPAPFAIAVPGAGIAPDNAWRRLGNRIRATPDGGPTGYGSSLGLNELRSAIAAYVRRARGVRCEMDNIIITSGTQQGLYMAARVLLSQGDAVWAENPAYPGLTAVLDDVGALTHRLPIDEEGLQVEYGLTNWPNARAAFVTPSHQYPLGMPLSMARRQALVAWAEQANAWIVEDDYDSELRYAGHPFPAMQGLSPTRVIYLGTFSKILFPSLRLGYLVAPTQLVEAFAGARAMLDRHSPTADQHVLAAYMQEGLFEAHVRRIRNLYAERRAVLLTELSSILPSEWKVQPCDQGMHIILWLPCGAEDVQFSEKARRAGIVTRPVSPMYEPSTARSGLMLGFGGFTAKQLQDAVVQLSQIIRQL